MGPGSTRLSTGEACAPAQPSERIGVPGHLRIGLTARGPVAAGFHRIFKRATNNAGRGTLFEARDVRVATRYLAYRVPRREDERDVAVSPSIGDRETQFTP